MVVLVVRILAGGVLAAAIAGKLAAPARTRAALANLGLAGGDGHRDPHADDRRAAGLWGAALVLEVAALAATVAGPRVALLAPAALFAVFALILTRALRQGAAGRPCGCFGARSTVSVTAAARNAGLAALLVTTALVPNGTPSTDTLQWIALGALATLTAALGVGVLALAREIGALKIAARSVGAALELDHEGPPLGARVDVTGWVDPRHDGLAVAIFTSEGCAMCRNLEPAVAYLARDPWLAVRTFDEVEAQDAWRAFAVPGSPFGVVLDADGTVRAKGTFNGLAQLEGLVASGARRRVPEPAGV